MRSLPLFVRVAGRPVILVGSGPPADAKRRLLERAGAEVVGEADTNARLAFVALEDGEEASRAAERLRARGLLVNAADRPELCDFTVPAIVDRDPVLLAIGTDGRSAGLAKALRQRLERILPAGLGATAERLFGLRARLAQLFPDAADRRRAIDDALAEGGPLDPLGIPAPDDRWVDGATPAQPTTRERVVVRSPDPDMLTLRDARLLASADRVVHEAGVPPAILARARADAERAKLGEEADPAPGLTVEVVTR